MVCVSTVAMMENMADPTEFTPLKVSTTTVTSSFPCPVNIIDLAKYLPLDDVIIGIKLVYAGGNSSIIRGVAKISTKAKDFYNQVTFTIRLPLRKTRDEIENNNDKPSSILISCKIFHNGTLHVTGTHNLDEACDGLNLLLERLLGFNGLKMVAIRPHLPFITSYDNLLYGSHGNVIGWIDPATVTTLVDNVESKDSKESKDSQESQDVTDCTNLKTKSEVTKPKGSGKPGKPGKPLIYMRNEYVVLEKISIAKSSFYVFVSNKWIDNSKRIYTLDGESIGRKRLIFNLDISRRHFDVQFGYIYAGNKIVGKEIDEWEPKHLRTLQKCSKHTSYLLKTGGVLHPMHTFPEQGAYQVETLLQILQKPFSHRDFNVYMINMFFKAPFKICRKRLHKAFLDNDYYSRFEPCSHAAVNLRFHYNVLTVNDETNCGKCVKVLNRTCNCKDISVSCFNSGKMNITGLANEEQGHIVYNFLKKFFLQHRKEIESDTEDDNLIEQDRAAWASELRTWLVHSAPDDFPSIQWIKERMHVYDDIPKLISVD